MPNQPESSKAELHEGTAVYQAGDAFDIYVGPYKLIKKLDEGGMGEVYLAEDAKLGRRIALKMLLAQCTQDHTRVSRFVREAKAASSLNHPNIITIYEIGESNGRHYLATEFIEGQTLRGLMVEPRPIAEVLEFGIQLAGALSAAHNSGIIHRDIKPENVMVRPDGLLKILDFGIAKLVERTSSTFPTSAENETLLYGQPAPSSSAEITDEGMILGTIAYMSPEQVRGETLDARSDIFSVGTVLYEAVAGTPPFAGKTLADKVAAIITTEPAPLRNVRLDVPPKLESIIELALRKDREARYQRIEDMFTDLKELKRQLEFQQNLDVARPIKKDNTGSFERSQTGQQTVVRTTSSTKIIFSELKRHKRASLIVLLILLLAMIGLGYFVYGNFVGSGNSQITSLAVLPFQNMSNDPEKDYLADGISESLINRLSQLPGVKVIAYGSSSRYKGKDVDPSQISRTLGVTGIVTGRLSQRGDQLTISVELINARDGTQVWGEQYKRRAIDVLNVQGEISLEIAENLRARLTAGQKEQFAKRDQVKPEAYDLLLKGYAHRAKGSTEDRKIAAQYFNQAIGIDPQYALAYAELSDIYRSLVGSGLLDPGEYTAKARAAAQKAREIDDGLAEAHYASANMKTFAWEWQEAEHQYKRAIEVNPNLALAHRWYALYLSLMSRHEEAIDEIKRAKDLDPLSPGVNATLGYVLYQARRYDKAIESLNATREMNKDYPYTYLFLGFTFSGKRMYDRASSAYQEAIRLGLDTPNTQIFLGTAYALSGDRDRGRAVLKRLQTENSYASPGELAILYDALGEREEAFLSLEKAYETRDPQLQNLGVNPAYDPLRSDPRYQDLLRRVGLTH